MLFQFFSPIGLFFPVSRTETISPAEPLLRSICFEVIGGGVFYNEFRGFDSGRSFGFLLGIGLTVIGVYFLSQRDIADNSKQVLVNFENTPSRIMNMPYPSRRSMYGTVSLDKVSLLTKYSCSD